MGVRSDEVHIIAKGHTFNCKRVQKNSGRKIGLMFGGRGAIVRSSRTKENIIMTQFEIRSTDNNKYVVEISHRNTEKDYTYETLVFDTLPEVIEAAIEFFTPSGNSNSN